MALSPSHRLGQIIGDELEAAVHKSLLAVAEDFGLYLDYKHERSARGGKKTVAWTDSHGNTHDLDYVLEENGSESIVGRPRAFIEVAWRRYTRHSRNKAQEIQGAIRPLAETHQLSRPFLGVVLAGEFTGGSLDQLRSHNFNLLYCPYDSIMQAFSAQGIDVWFDEDTSEADLQSKVDAFDHLGFAQREEIAGAIRELHAAEFATFFDALRSSLHRRVTQVLVLTLSGVSHSFDRVADAVRFVSEHDQAASVSAFVRYELNVRYSNGDEVRGQFQEKETAIGFLRSL